MRFALLCVTSATLYGQAAPDPNAVLEQARTRLQAMAHNLEKYVCAENVNRSYYQRVTPAEAPAHPDAPALCGPASGGGARLLESTDRVRLEVTLSDGRELHSWPGATRFDTRNVDELIRDGPVSTGSFGGDLAGIFGGAGVSFRYLGPQTVDGKTLFEYHYQVPVEASRFQIKVSGAWVPAPYEGEFRIDPQTFQLDSMTLRTNQLPAAAAFCAASTALAYQYARVGETEILLPRQSQLDIDLKSGRETRNLTTFSSCREYQAESEIVFESAPEPGAKVAQAAPRPRVALPIGLPVLLALTAPIDTATASAGDAVSAKLVKPVRRLGTNEELIPAGATVHGRIRRVERHLLPSPYFLVAIAFNRVDVQGTLSPFFAHSDPNPDVAKELGANLAMRDTGIWFWGVGTFLFPSSKDHMVIPAGYETKWFTLSTTGR
ncbi:MAG TPA: hypothetical protein VG456_02410 [Candidatus Sulfopaludibacter sp.]|jgi:hypothetical protein|nr:hypothetical protein [Candidatus Sulfopaludibacter sp.]